MISLWMSIVLFLPVFLAINLAAAIPGRPVLRDALRIGFRHFVVGTAVIFAGSAALHFLMEWLIRRPPLW